MAITSTLIKSFQYSALTTALALAGCGGGGNDTLQPPLKAGSMVSANPSTPAIDATTTKNLASVKTVQLVSSSADFYMNVGDSIELTAYALDAKNMGVANVPVTVQITDPNVTGVYSGISQNLVTDTTGKAVIKLDIKSLTNDQKNYLKQNGLTVTTTVGTVTSSKILKGTDVKTTAQTPAINVSNLLLISDSQTIALVKGTKIYVTALAVDKDNNIIPNTTIDFNIGNSVLTGIFANTNLSVLTNDKGEAKLELELKSLSDEQRNYLLTTGLVINSTAKTGGVASNTMVLKGQTIDNASNPDVKKVNLTTPNSTFNIKVGEKFTVTASVLNSTNTGMGGVPVQFTLDDPSSTGVYAVSDTANVVTNSSGEATIELQVKSEAAKAKLLSQGINITAIAKNTSSATPVAVKGQLNILGKDPTFNENIAKVAKAGLSTNISNNEFDLTVGNTLTVTANVLDAAQGALANVPVTFTLPGLDQTGVANLSGSTVTTDAQGKATINLSITSLNATQRNYLLTNGLVVNASVPNGTNVAPLKLLAKKESTVADIAKVNLVTDKNTLTTNAGDIINVTAQVRDANNVSLANMPVAFTLVDPTTATGVTNITPLEATTNADGEAVLSLKVGALTPDQQYYLQTNGLSFKATAGAITSSTVTLKTQEAITANSVRTLLLTTDSAVQMAVGSRVRVTAVAMDDRGAVIPNAQVSFRVPTDSGLVNNSGAVITTNATGEAVAELEIKDLAKAASAFQNGVVITAQSGIAVGTTTVVTASSQSATQAYNVFISKSKDELRTGTDSMSMTIRVTDTNGGIKANVPVYLQILADGIARGLAFNNVSTLKTDDKGLVTVDLSQNDIGLVSRLNGTGKINVIVNDGVYRAEKEEITIPITGTTVDNLFVSNKEISDTTNSTISATALDGSGKPFANTKVELLLNGNSLATPKFVNTDAQGKFTFTASQADIGQAANYPLSVRLFGTNTQGVEISSSPIALTELKPVSQTETKLEVRSNNVLMANNEILVNTTGQITILRPKDKTGALLTNGAKVYLSTNKGTLNAQGTRVEGTVQNQQVTFSISSAVANTANLVLEYNGEQIFTDSMSFLAKDVANPLILQLERTTLSTNGETNVISTVKDPQGLPVKNAIVEFSLVQDPSGGRLEKGYAITDDSGNATVKYFSGRTPTANDAVQIQATVRKIQINGHEENTNQTVVSEIKTMTVQTNATFIGFGFADKIRQHPDGRQIYYVYDGSIFVNNNIGQPAANQPVSISIIPVQYLLGEYYVIPKVPGKAAQPAVLNPVTGEVITPAQDAVADIPAKWGVRSYDSAGMTLPYAFNCANEDANNNGILDNLEDANGNGKLDPLNPATILSANGTEVVNGQTITTDGTGKLDFSIRYTKESAEWFVGMIKVTTKVNGTEFVEYRTLTLPAAKEDVSEPDATSPTRPNWISPFGNRTMFNGYTTINGKNYCR